MRRRAVLAWTFLVAGLAATTTESGYGYELPTHARMCSVAFGQSALGQDTTLQTQLGITAWTFPSATAQFPFRAGTLDLYVDRSGTETHGRVATGYEASVLESIQATSRFRIEGWLMRGVVREDDGGAVAALVKGEPKNDAPFPLINRFCNHFFDPAVVHPTGRGFSGFCSSDPIFDAAQWGLGSNLPFDPSPPELSERTNHFTVLDAREAMWRALTLLNRSGNPLPSTIDSASYSTEDLRRVYWATTFRALGDVMHTVQDLGQPQHTRNEGHGLTSNLGYEEYLSARTTGETQYTIDGYSLTTVSVSLPDLTYTGYPIPSFNRYSDYFSTLVTSGLAWGLADYSNRGFLTPASNIGNTNYALPSAVAADYTIQPGPASLGFSTNYLVGQVKDGVTKGTDTITMSTQSTFFSYTASYTMSKQNYDDRAALLIPRATAYSAGLLNYFFRGSMVISLPDAGLYASVDHSTFSNTDVSGFVGFRTIRMKILNTTSKIKPPGTQDAGLSQEMGAGNLVAVAKFHRNLCYHDDLSGEKTGSNYSDGCARSSAEEIVVSDIVSVNSIPSDTPKEYEFQFSQKQIPINATDLYVQVVFRGPLGQELDAVVVATKDISEPTYLSFINSSDYIRIAGHFYTRDQINSDPSLLAQIQPQTCVKNGLLVNSPSCYVPSQISGTMYFFSDSSGAHPPVTASVSSLPLRQFSRIALLTDDLGVQPNMLIQTGNAFAWPYLTSENQWYFISNGSTIRETTEVTSLRQTYQGNSYSFVWYGDGTSPDPSDKANAPEMTIALDIKQPVAFTALTTPPITP